MTLHEIYKREAFFKARNDVIFLTYWPKYSCFYFILHAMWIICDDNTAFKEKINSHSQLMIIKSCVIKMFNCIFFIFQPNDIVLTSRRFILCHVVAAYKFYMLISNNQSYLSQQYPSKAFVNNNRAKQYSQCIFIEINWITKTCIQILNNCKVIVTIFLDLSLEWCIFFSSENIICLNYNWVNFLLNANR